jgi:hypothetical protein
VAAGYSWQAAEKVTVTAQAGGNYKQISKGGGIGECGQMSRLGVAEVGGSIMVRASENVNLALQASAGSVVAGSRETRSAAGTDESKAASGTVAGIQAGVEWKLSGERLSLTTGVVFEQAKVSYERGADDSYGKTGLVLGLNFKF